ncbi:TonB-dependent receptor [Edaphobacter bradus]|uniref:TonB-dependent receptor n=1 Tax=Edaphobacter bradus TaxID=2259016 RepID=UPI0021E08A56|nr:TonB-dependent receptor [Edaphobacter bradus]
MMLPIVRMARRAASALTLLLVVFALLPAAYAQETTASIEGTVRDKTGAAIASATVTVSGDKLIGIKTISTDKSGYYRFDNLPPGTYNVLATAAGFAELKREGLVLQTGRIPTVDLNLSVGSEQTVVEVSAETPVIDVTSSRQQTTVSKDEIDYAPRGRSYQSVIAFAPGARNEPLQGGFQIDGGATAENSYLVNGMETGSMVTGKSAANVPFEFVQEVQVKTGGIEAENGGALGGVVNVIGKRGGNTWHGNVWMYYEGDPMDSSYATTPLSQYDNVASHQGVTLRSDPLGTYCPAGTTSKNCNGVAPRSDYAAQFYTPQKDHFRYIQPGFDAGGYLKKDRLWLWISSAPLVQTQRRIVNFTNPNCAAVGCPGIRQFNYSEQTYFTAARVDLKVTEKIRLYGGWQYAFDRTTGSNLVAGSNFPTADSIYGQYNSATANPVDSYQGAIGSVSPNVIYTAGADITLTSNLVSTTRFGNFFQNYADRGLPQGDRYLWVGNALASQTPLDVTSTQTLGTANPNAVRSSGNYNISTNLGYQYNANSRTTFNEDLAYFKKGFFGTHNLKGGYQFGHFYENVNQIFTNDLVRLTYGNTYAPGTSLGAANCATIVAQNTTNYGTPGGNSSGCQGNWGYVNIRDGNEITGKASSNNHAFYIQDSWQVLKGFTANVGVRFEHEKLPSYNKFPSGIDFGWGSKIAPRIGGAWDVFQNGKLKLNASYAAFYDVMKLNLAIGSFGGNYWHDCVYALDTPDFSKVKPVKDATGHYCPTGGAAVQANFAGGSTPSGLRFIENQDFRIPSNDPSQGAAVDPNIKPYKEHEAVAGVAYQISRDWAVESRFTRRRLDRVIEDVGYIGPDGEAFIIANPGFGTDAGGATTNCPTCKLQPKAARNYDAVEFRLTRTATRHWFGQFAYTYSRLRGNYSGLTSTDIADGGGARANPNNNRSFDEPQFQFDAYGKPSDGLLATDRPNSFKGIAYYRFSTWKRNEPSIGLFQQASSGTPISTFADVNGSAGSYPVYVEGRGKWIDITRDVPTGNWVFGKTYTRRTPWYTQSDLSLTDSYRVSDAHEAWRLGFEAQFTNLLNQKAATVYQSRANASGGSSANYILPAGSTAGNPNYGILENGYDWKTIANNGNGLASSKVNRGPLVLSNQYGLPSGWQAGRSIRLKVNFTF